MLHVGMAYGRRVGSGGLHVWAARERRMGGALAHMLNPSLHLLRCKAFCGRGLLEGVLL